MQKYAVNQHLIGGLLSSVQSGENVKVGNKAPHVYFAELRDQCNGGPEKYGGITSLDDLCHNLKENAIPEEIFDMDISRYEEFLEARRILMARQMQEYYRGL